MPRHYEFTTPKDDPFEQAKRLEEDAWRILNLVVAEWESDPMSVQCFDLRMVEDAKQTIAKRKALDKIPPFTAGYGIFNKGPRNA